MPIYEYICELGHITEKLKSVADRDITPWCEECMFLYSNEDEGHVQIPTERVWSLPAKSAPNDNGKGVVYFENGKGQVIFNSFGDKDNWHPKGYVKKEARSLAERLSLESKIRNQDNSRLAKQREERDIHRHYSEKVRHSDLRNAINQGEIVLPDTDSQGRKVTVKLTEKHKTLLKRGIDRTNKRKQKRTESEFRLSVNHDTSSTIKNKG